MWEILISKLSLPPKIQIASSLIATAGAASFEGTADSTACAIPAHVLNLSLGKRFAVHLPSIKECPSQGAFLSISLPIFS
jgi:hypothetical protein